MGSLNYVCAQCLLMELMHIRVVNHTAEEHNKDKKARRLSRELELELCPVPLYRSLAEDYECRRGEKVR